MKVGNGLRMLNTKVRFKPMAGNKAARGTWEGFLI
jgi:hypothetical protein